jgi:hypothetical protein
MGGAHCSTFIVRLESVEGNIQGGDCCGKSVEYMNNPLKAK